MVPYICKGTFKNTAKYIIIIIKNVEVFYSMILSRIKYVKIRNVKEKRSMPAVPAFER